MNILAYTDVLCAAVRTHAIDTAVHVHGVAPAAAQAAVDREIATFRRDWARFLCRRLT